MTERNIMTAAKLEALAKSLKKLEKRIAKKADRLKSIHHDDWKYGWFVADNDEIDGILRSIAVEVRVVASALRRIRERLQQRT